METNILKNIDVSPPSSPRKRNRPVYTVDSYDSSDGRSVDEMKKLIKKVLTNNYQAFEEVRKTGNNHQNKYSENNQRSHFK